MIDPLLPLQMTMLMLAIFLEQSKIYSLFLLRNGTADWIFIGERRYSDDLPQGGLEVLRKLLFNGTHNKKLKCKKTVVNK